TAADAAICMASEWAKEDTPRSMRAIVPLSSGAASAARRGELERVGSCIGQGLGGDDGEARRAFGPECGRDRADPRRFGAKRVSCGAGEVVDSPRAPWPARASSSTEAPMSDAFQPLPSDIWPRFSQIATFMRLP